MTIEDPDGSLYGLLDIWKKKKKKNEQWRKVIT